MSFWRHRTKSPIQTKPFVWCQKKKYKPSVSENRTYGESRSSGSKCATSSPGPTNHRSIYPLPAFCFPSYQKLARILLLIIVKFLGLCMVRNLYVKVTIKIVYSYGTLAIEGLIHRSTNRSIVVLHALCNISL